LRSKCWVKYFNNWDFNNFLRCCSAPKFIIKWNKSIIKIENRSVPSSVYSWLFKWCWTLFNWRFSCSCDRSSLRLFFSLLLYGLSRRWSWGLNSRLSRSRLRLSCGLSRSWLRLSWLSNWLCGRLSCRLSNWLSNRLCSWLNRFLLRLCSWSWILWLQSKYRLLSLVSILCLKHSHRLFSLKRKTACT